MLRNSPPGACLIRLLRLGLLATLLASCGTKSPDLPAGADPHPHAPAGHHPPPPQVVTPIPTITRAATPSPPAGTSLTLADFWDGHAHFVLQEQYTGLPMGESDTIALSNGELWSYMHSSSQHPAGTIDQCGNPVPFPGCTVIYRSSDGGYRFQHANPPVCQFTCQQCPCNSENDHIEQQQYPRVHYDAATQTLYLVYEYLGRTMLRTSSDGLNWSRPERVAQTGIWKTWLMPCPAAEHIGQHPFVPYDYECLAGGPPGIYVADGLVYVFVAVGQSPAGMGCYVGRTGQPPGEFQRCASNPSSVAPPNTGRWTSPAGPPTPTSTSAPSAPPRSSGWAKGTKRATTCSTKGCAAPAPAITATPNSAWGWPAASPTRSMAPGKPTPATPSWPTCPATLAWGMPTW